MTLRTITIAAVFVLCCPIVSGHEDSLFISAPDSLSTAGSITHEKPVDGTPDREKAFFPVKNVDM